MGVDASEFGPGSRHSATSDVPVDQRDVIEATIGRVSESVSERLPDVTRGMRTVLARAIAELAGDNPLIELLGGAIEGNVGTILHMLRHRIPLPEVEVPSGAVAHARRLAQQGVPVFALVRAYRLGQGYLLEELYSELSERCSDPQLSLLAFKEINVRLLDYIDWVSQEIVTVYETERDQWVRNRDAARAAQVQEIVAGRGGPDTAAAEEALRYRLDQHHVAAILWTDEDTSSDSLGNLEAAATALATVLCPGESALTVAADGSTTWAWFPRGAGAEDPEIQCIETAVHAAELTDVRVSLGGAARSIEGFRDSHRQAAEARRVLLTGGDPTPRTIGYRQPGVAAAALLTHTMDRTRAMVHAVLGPLASDANANERLRDTLLRFLECGSSYTATAQRLMLHKNSVKYRVERALAQRARPLGDDRVDVELALVACRWLRGAVLRPHAGE